MRNISNETIKNFIEKDYGFTEETIEEIILVTIVFEDGRMGTSIYINDDVFIDCGNDIIFVENDMVELQKEIKELGTFLYIEYGAIAKIEMLLFDGMREECVF